MQSSKLLLFSFKKLLTFNLFSPGSGVFSHILANKLSSLIERLTTEFGMGSGRTAHL